MWNRTATIVAAVALVAACSTTVTAAPSARPHSGTLMAAAIMPHQATVIINGAHPGLVFQGIGAISGGGGNSRLLIDYPPPTTGYRRVVAAQARTLAARMAKPLWESELGATPATGTNPALRGPGGLARALNDAYNQAGITGILVWPLIDAIPPDLPHENQGLVLADLPWDGYYHVTPLTWVIAQTTQFTAPGWRHVAGANGDLPAGGSYDTYLAPGRSAWSMVAQTSVATAAQRVTIRVTGGLPTRVVHVWSTNLRGPGQFIQRGDIIPHKGAFAALLQPGYIYTFTTTTGQSRADGHPPGVPGRPAVADRQLAGADLGAAGQRPGPRGTHERGAPVPVGHAGADRNACGDEDRLAHPAAQRTAHHDVERSLDGLGDAVPDVGRTGPAGFPGDQAAASRRGPDADMPADRRAWLVGEP